MADPSDPDGSSPRGPLDQLVPGLRTPEARVPLSAVHPRALELSLADEGHALVLCAWRSPGSAAALHGALKPLVEAAMLAELSRPVDELRELDRPFRALHLYAFEPFGFNATPALLPFGLTGSTTAPDADWRAAAALLRREALRVEGETTDSPVERFEAWFAQAPDPRVRRAEAQALSQAPAEPWGAQPGALSRCLADALTAEGITGIEPTHAGIQRFEEILVPDATGAIRWLSPIAFQALCDLLAVAAHQWGTEVQWGVCEPDDETGLAPPPLIRASRGSRSGHVPLGEHVLRWCVMPRQPGEDIPPLADWARHEFGED